jgi:protein-arginine kinase activator protein McsA
MLIISSKEFGESQVSHFDRIDNGEENETIISKERILEPDEDLARAISFEEFRESAINHIRGLYKQKKK